VLLAFAVWFGTGGLLWSVALRSDSDILWLVGDAFHGEENMPSPDEPEVAPILPGSSEWIWAQTIWDYHHLHHQLEKADGIMVLCSHDLRVADEATRLLKAGLGNWVIFSGGFGTGPHSGANLNGWTRPEAEIFAEAGVHHDSR
jgi:rhodanese-related sulfurtransferase